jgi:hypothetical protein
MDFGWKKKAERLRRVILSGAHQIAKELPPGISKMLSVYKRVAEDGGSVGGGPALMQELSAELAAHADDPKPLWEPIEVHGWKIVATLYLREEKLWWLVHATRKSDRPPSDKDIVFLDKVLDHLGAVPTRAAIIGPRSSPPGEEPLPFGWWTWQNRDQLYDIQVNKDKKRDADKVRIVPLGSRTPNGYMSLSLKQRAELDELASRQRAELEDLAAEHTRGVAESGEEEP